MTGAQVGAEDAGLVEQARAAYRRRDWSSARRFFEQARDVRELDPDDHYALSNCCWWLGDLDTALPEQQQVYQRYLDAEVPATAALVAIDVGYTHLLRGDQAQGSGWIARAMRLLEERPDSVEFGYLVHLEFETAFGESELVRATHAARRVQALGRRHHDATLTALGVLGQGRVLVRRGEVAKGMALLDEAMLAAVSDELDPGWAGNIYCHLMVACHEIADLRRAGEWTEVTARWCDSMPGAGPFMGICRVHRAQVLQVRGEWDAAEREATHVCGEYAHFSVEIVAEAHYLLGDLKRVRGDLEAAEASYREAHRLGRDPQPGLALLRLLLGDTDTAAASIRSALAATDGDPSARARLLPAAVEVALATADRERARRWSDELADAARIYGTTGFVAASLQARGAVLLADGDGPSAVPVLRKALIATKEHDAPLDVARLRLLLAEAYERVGDHAAATLERDASAADLARLGVLDRARTGPARSGEDRTGADRSGADRSGAGGASRGRTIPGGLTGREVEVLTLVADGRSNQEIAAELVLSVRTVERHLATTYQKLGLQGRSARAGAVSFALREGILARG